MSFESPRVGNVTEAPDLFFDKAAIDRLTHIARVKRKELKTGNADLALTKDYYGSFKDEGSGEEVSVSEYLSRHPEIVDKYASLRVETPFKKYTQEVSLHTKEERQFLESIRNMCDGLFGEMMIIVLRTASGKKIREYAFSARADGVSKEDIERALEKNKNEVVVGVQLIHNHPDLLEKQKVKSQRSGEDIGLIAASGLSNLDMETADGLTHTHFPNAKVMIVAVSENGLTYRYEAGTERVGVPGK